MGAYTCEFGKVHKRCRCHKAHTIKCNTPDVHAPNAYADEAVCIVWRKKSDGRLDKGKHEAHPGHYWFYTSEGGGHQLYDEYVSGDEKGLKKWWCPGG